MHRSHAGAIIQNEEVRLIPVAGLDSDDLSAWKALAREALEPNLFFEPEFVLPLAAARPQDDVHLLVVKSAKRWIVCMPTVIRWGWRKIPVPVLATWLSQYTFLGTPLVAPEGTGPLLRLLEEVHKTRSGLLVFEWIAADGVVSSLLRQALARYDCPVVDWERFDRAAVRRDSRSSAKISSKHRSELGRRRRSLEREYGAQLRLVDRAGDPCAVEEFLALEAAGWKGVAGTAIASRDSDAKFFREVCATLASEGRMQLLSLVGTRTLAMQCNFISGDVLFGFRSCYDEALARYSPGALLLMDAVSHFHADQRATFDSCTAPDNDLCNRLMQDRRALETIIIGRPDALGSALTVTMKTAEVMRRARGSMRDAGWIATARRWMHGVRSPQAIGE